MAKIVGITDINSENGILTYTDDLEGVERFHLENDTSGYYTSLYGITRYKDLLPFSWSTYTDEYGVEYVRITKFYVRYITYMGILTGMQLSDEKLKGFEVFECFKNYNGEGETPYVDISAHELSATDGKLIPLAHVPTVSISEAETYCKESGARLMKIPEMNLLTTLSLFYFGYTNIQKLYFGATLQGGVVDSDYFTRHTTSDNVALSRDGVFRIYGIDNIFGNCNKYVSDLYIKNNEKKLYYRLHDNQEFSTIDLGENLISEGWGTYVDKHFFPVSNVNGGHLTGFGDFFKYETSSSTVYPRVFGDYNSGWSAGVSCYYFDVHSLDERKEQSCFRAIKRPNATLNPPELKNTRRTLHWDPVDYATSYIIYKDGVELATTNETNYQTEADGIYTVASYTDREGFENLSVKSKEIIMEETFIIDFYNYSAENNRLNKTPYLTNLLSVNGTLVEGATVLEPKFEVVFEGLNVPTYNYCYISKLNRYYFVSNISPVSIGVWKMTMTVDVLMSFKEEILNQNAMIERTAATQFSNPLLKDSLLPLNTNYDLKYTTIENDVFVALDDKATTATFVVVADGESGSSNELIAHSGDGIIKQPNSYILPETPFTKTWLLGLNELEKLSSYLFENPEQASYISSISIYPIKFGMLSSSGLKNSSLKIAGKTICTKCGDVNNVLCQHEEITGSYIDTGFEFVLNCGSFFIESNNSYLDYSPYRKLSLYLLFYGVLELDNNKSVGKNLSIKLIFSLVTGTGTYVIEDTDNNYLLYSVDCQLNIDIPINADNSQVNSFKRISNHLSSFFSTVSTIAGGIANQNPAIAITSAVASTGISTISNNLTTLDSVQVSRAGGSANPLFLPQQAILYDEFVQPSQDKDEFYELYGAPCFKYLALNNLNGFTKIAEVNMKNTEEVLSQEIEKIKELLTSGIII